MNSLTLLLQTLREEAFENISQAKKQGTRRQLAFPTATNMIKVAIGMRRSGKTYFLYQTINDLLAQGIDKQQILFINFEDDRLLPMTAKDMGALLDTFYTLYPDNHNQCCYIFLDEVQNVTEWQQVVRRYFDSKNVQLYITGSSAKLLSKEIATALRGRSLSIEVPPYSFSEFLQAHKIHLPTDLLGQKTFDQMHHQVLRFFETGGFPAVQHLPKNEWRDTLQNYVDTVILRDIIERHGVSNVVLLKYLTNTLIKNAATTFSINKFYNDAKSQQHKLSKDTVYTYMEYLEDAFLIFSVPLYTESARLKQTTAKKIYAIDNGLVNAASLGTNALYNKFLENQVYLDLRRAGKSIYFYKTSNHYEVDFVTIDKEGKKELIQVTVDMTDPTTMEREQRALAEAEKELGIKGKIITLQSYLEHQHSLYQK